MSNTNRGTCADGTYHDQECHGRVHEQYDRNCGNQVVGYECAKCGRSWDWNDRVRDGPTFRYPLSDTERGGE